MFGRKKIPNPKVKEFEQNIKKRGLLLVDGSYYCSSVTIYNANELLSFAKRSKVGTIFRYIGVDHVHFFCIVNGCIVKTYFEGKVSAK